MAFVHIFLKGNKRQRMHMEEMDIGLLGWNTLGLP